MLCWKGKDEENWEKQKSKKTKEKFYKKAKQN
jgi:hypothetical protein